jgi:hypothetical protein
VPKLRTGEQQRLCVVVVVGGGGGGGVMLRIETLLEAAVSRVGR